MRIKQLFLFIFSPIFVIISLLFVLNQAGC